MTAPRAPAAEVLRQLRQQLRQVSRSPQGVSGPSISTGLPVLDELLPDRGVPAGSLVEWLTPSAAGASLLAAAQVRQALAADHSAEQIWVVIDAEHTFYPPAALSWGLPLDRLVLVRPTSATEHLWAIEQSLRCPGVAVVWAWVGRQSDQVLRRWQLAAEQGGTLGTLFRPTSVRRSPSWATVRWLLQPAPPAERPSERPLAARPVAETLLPPGRRVTVELCHCRGTCGGTTIELDLHDETNSVHLVPPVAAAASAGSRTTRRRPAARAVC